MFLLRTPGLCLKPLPDGGNALGECVACFRAQGLGQETVLVQAALAVKDGISACIGAGSQEAADAISQGKAAFLGCVLNNMQTGFRFGRTSAYGYGGYGYGYGYGSEKQGSRTEGRGR